MIIPDVNVVVHAWWADSGEHERARLWLEDAVSSSDVVGISELVLSGAVRVLTHPRVTGEAFTSREVLRRADELRGAAGVTTIRPGRHHWRLFRELCLAVDARGNTVPDCYHAALALEHDAVWISLDRSFADFPGVRWQRPW